MSTLSFRRDLGLQLFAIYLLFVGPVVGAAILFDMVAGARLQRDVKAADLALAQSIALETDAILQNALNTVNALAPLPEVQTTDIPKLRPLFTNIAAARSEVNLVYRLDPDGIMVYHYPEGPGSTLGVDFSFRAHYTKSLVISSPFMTIGRISPTTGVPVVTAVMAVRDNDEGNYLGIVATNLSLLRLSSTLARIASDPEAGLRVTMIDEVGQIVADSEDEHLLADARLEFPAETGVALRGETGSQIGQDATAREWLRSYVPIHSAGWAVIVQRPTDVAFASARAFHNGLLIAIGVFITGGISFWMVLARRVIAPLEWLANFSVAISRRAVSGADRTHLATLAARSDQMGHLMRSLATMEQNIERRLAELATLLDTSTAVVSSLDPQRVLDTILEQVQRLLDVNMCAIVSLDERTGELRLRASRGLSVEYVRAINTRQTPADETLPSIRAIRTGQLIQVGDTETDPIYPGWLRERALAEGFRALAAVPLVTRHAPPTALLLYWPGPHTCSTEEIHLIVSFANHAAMAIENAALFGLTDERLREQTRTLEALVQSLNDGLILESSDGRIVYFNRRICELTDRPPDDVAAQTAAALQTGLLARAVGQTTRAADGAAPASVRELSLRHNGRTLDLRLQSFEVNDEHNRVIGRGHLWLDVTGDKELDRMKSALIAAVSHELRTPLAGIKGNITSLLEEDVHWDAAAQREFLKAASAEADRLTNLVTDLLDLSRIQAGMLVVHREPCSLPQLADRAACHAHPMPGARFVCEVLGDFPLLLADPLRIEAVLRNLIENAVKYSPPGSPIRLTAERANGLALIRVADEGPGISPEHREKIFDRFYQIQNGHSPSVGGVGLGLAICKGFVEAHGGRIWAEPAPRGTVVAFELPIEAP